MNKINILLISLLSIFSVTGQNLLKDGVSGFEGEEVSGWWIQHKNIFHFSNKKANGGKHSLKFFRSPASGEKGSMQVHNKKAFKKPLKSGKYKLTAKVYLGSNIPAGFNFNFSGKNWLPVHVSFDGLRKKKWVEVSREFKVKKIVEGGVIIAVAESEQYGGYGSFYLDDIKVVKIK
ncbi:hypothetical protein [Aquimarina agarilytica]|uniref:hypothetical protein n=1 Tax=Aquimarina agarilytica TaxID=1087449 RepID=UPI00028A3C8A|nr:hypothetical protein [Aquimarina agarilytica]